MRVQILGRNMNMEIYEGLGFSEKHEQGDT